MPTKIKPKAITVAYPAMLEATKRIGYPLHFTTDLTTHDRAALALVPDDQRFAWCVYEHGTHLVRDVPTTRLGRPVTTAEAIRSANRAIEGIRYWFAWDGVALRRFETVEALADFFTPERG